MVPLPAILVQTASFKSRIGTNLPVCDRSYSFSPGLESLCARPCPSVLLPRAASFKSVFAGARNIVLSFAALLLRDADHELMQRKEKKRDEKVSDKDLVCE